MDGQTRREKSSIFKQRVTRERQSEPDSAHAVALFLTRSQLQMIAGEIWHMSLFFCIATTKLPVINVSQVYINVCTTDIPRDVTVLCTARATSKVSCLKKLPSMPLISKELVQLSVKSISALRKPIRFCMMVTFLCSL